MGRLLKRNSILKLVNEFAYDSLLPSNLNYFYNLGSLLAVLLVIQILSGFFLASYYVPEVNLAFNSIEYIMREVPYGYMVRYIHANGAALFFIMIYGHIGRALLYGSYTIQRIGTWYLGVVILLLSIITAFLGYSLVYGQMSYWAIAVITNLLTVIPYFGHDLVQYIYGSFNIGNSTLSRFFALHYLLPIIIAALALGHLITLHNIGGTNPLGINTARSISFINFHPYYSIKDLFGIFVLLFALVILVFFYPNLLGHSDNYIPANPMVTPSHIIPEFYLLFYYMGLRAIPNKVLGVLALLSFILVLFLLPLLHKGVVNTSKFRPIYRIFLFIFFINFLIGTSLGAAIVSEPFITLSRISSFYYLFFILILFPIISFIETLFYSLLSSPSLSR